jgi:hypothetical protein
MEKQYQEWRAKTEEPFLIDEDFGDVLVLGAYPHFLDGGYLSPMLGVFLSPVDPPDIALLAKGYPPRELDFYADQGCFRYRMGGDPPLRAKRQCHRSNKSELPAALVSVIMESIEARRAASASVFNTRSEFRIAQYRDESDGDFVGLGHGHLLAFRR